MSDFVLETERLRLRPVRAAEADAFRRLWSEPAVRRYLFDDRVVTLEEARGFLERSAQSFGRDGWGLWRVDPVDLAPDDTEDSDDASEGPPAGFVGFLRSEEGLPDLIYGMHPAHQGRGYAGEAARAVLDHLFARCDAPRALASVDEPNAASVRILEKLGMRLVRRDTGAAGGLLFYALERPPG